MSEIIIAQVANIGADGIHLLTAGATTPTAKGYKRLASASVAAGDMVLVCEVSGTRVILDKIVLP